jgi:hypothetical protein
MEKRIRGNRAAMSGFFRVWAAIPKGILPSLFRFKKGGFLSK